MRIYHIVYNEGEFISKGENYEVANPVDALVHFEREHKGAIFISMHDIEALSRVAINAIEAQDYIKTYP